MRLYAPLYEGDSILRPDAALGEAAVPVFKAPAPASKFVRSNIPLEAANEPALDLHTIELTARAMRSAEFAHVLHRAYTAVANGLKAASIAVGDWLERNETYERDSFFSAAENLADLEQRQRHFERTGIAHY